jgi:hypothetical protein
MFEKVLSKNAKNTLAVLGKSELFKNSYLAGGTALALQIGHRHSYDFDFFSRKEFDEKILIQRLQSLLPDFQLEKIAWGTILGYIKDVRFSLFFYKYPLLFKPHKFLEINVADIRDIAPMKIAAIADRGTKRDFIDLYFITAVRKVLTIEQVLELYGQKFKVLQQNKAHILKSLVYFVDAEKDKMSQMIEKINWKMVKKFFEKEVKILSRKLLTS